jgi:hypothetical protein
MPPDRRSSTSFWIAFATCLGLKGVSGKDAQDVLYDDQGLPA